MTDTEVLNSIYNHYTEVKNFYDLMYKFYDTHETQDNIQKKLICIAKREMIEELLYAIGRLKG